MICINEAKALYLNRYPDRMIDEVYETNSCWVISGIDRVSGEELDSPPISVDKNTGEMKVYFPPAHTGMIQKNISCDEDN